MIENPTMQLINSRLRKRHGGLARFIAVRRVPGRDWKSFERIAQEIYAATGESVTRASVETWSKKYGIPTWRPTKLRPEPTDEQVQAYVTAVDKYMH